MKYPARSMTPARGIRLPSSRLPLVRASGVLVFWLSRRACQSLASDNDVVIPSFSLTPFGGFARALARRSCTCVDGAGDGRARTVCVKCAFCGIRKRPCGVSARPSKGRCASRYASLLYFFFRRFIWSLLAVYSEVSSTAAIWTTASTSSEMWWQGAKGVEPSAMNTGP